LRLAAAGWREGWGSVGRLSDSGEFVRDTRCLDGRITADGRDETFRVEAGRYRLVVARACPWANRTMIVRRLLGLESALSMGICGPVHDWRSWTFDLDPGGLDPVGDGTPPGPPPPEERVASGPGAAVP